MLRFILGRAGSGKSRTCLEQLAEALAERPTGPPLFLLVPEQATFLTEQALLRTLQARANRTAFMRAQVLSFQRLAWRVFQLAGGELPQVGRLGRRMILRALVQREAGQLRIFHRVAQRAGFIEALAATLHELKTQAVERDSLAASLEALEPRRGTDGRSLLAAKLHDLLHVASAYEAYLGEELADPADALARAAAVLPKSGLARNGRVWVDGFAGFTPQELELLGVLLEQAAAVEVALCLDPRDDRLDAPPSETALFHPTLETRRQLLALAEARRVAVGEPVLLPERRGEGFGDGESLPRFRAPELAHVERELFHFPGTPRTGEVRAVTVQEATGPRDEVEAAARAIRRLVRTRGWRYRELGVMVRDLEGYGELLRHTFARYEIPVFIDRRRPVPHHPLLELLRAALETLARDWPYEAVFRFLKTDLVPVPRPEIDRLENYVLEFGIRGSRWYDEQPWRFRRRYTLAGEDEREPDARRDLERELAELDAIRRRAAAPLLALRRRLRAGEKPHESRLPVPVITSALYEVLLADLDVGGRLEGWSEAAEARGELDRAQEHLQVWNGVVELLDELVAALPKAELTLEAYLEVLEAGFQALQVGLIPPGLDQVVVGTVERSRQPDVRATFILGVTEDAFPRRQQEDLIFTDPEREALARHGVELAATAGLRMLHEQYLTYIAVTRPRDHLWLSYPLADEEGRRQVPAFLIRRLQRLLPGLQVAGPQADGPESAATVEQLVNGLVAALRRARDGAALPEPWLDAYQWLVTQDGYRRQAAPLLASLDYGNRVPPLPRDRVEALFGPHLTASPSRLESFASCPFQHFARYALGLEERPVQQVEAPELGLFYHAALGRFTETLRERDLDWEALHPGQVDAVLGEVMDELVPRLQNEILTSTARYRFLTRRIERVLRTSILTLVEHARRGAFRPAGVEVAFGQSDDAPLPPLRYRLAEAEGKELVVQGRIDRVDVADPGGDGPFLRVVDYKSSRRRLVLDELYHGLALQLGLYLLAAWHGIEALTGWAPEDVAPAGLLYLPVQDPLSTTDGPVPAAEAQRKRRRQLRAAGWVLDDPGALAAMEAGGEGELIPVRLRKDGRPYKNAPVASRSELEALLGHVEAQVRELGARLLAGEIRPAPYRLRQHTPCRFCDYRPFCQFDPLVPGNAYRQLPPLPDREVLQRLTGAEDAGDDGGEEGGS